MSGQAASLSLRTRITSSRCWCRSHIATRSSWHLAVFPSGDPRRLFLLAWTAWWQLAIATQGTPRASAAAPENLIVTTQPTVLYRRGAADGKEDGLQPVKEVPRSSVFKASGRPIVVRGRADEYWPVSADGLRGESFVPQNHSFNLTAMRHRVQSRNARSSSRLATPDKEIPAVVRLAHPAIIAAWRDLDPVYRQNARLPLAEQSPDPFFGRAHLWAAVGNNTDALSDYLEAASLVRSQKTGNLVAYARYFTVLESAISLEETQPGVPYVAGARSYWGRGISLYRQGRLNQALAELTDAVRLDPAEPLYWYSRALTYKALGRHQLAERDGRIGVTAERRMEDRRKEAAEIVYDAGKPDQHLSIFQGRNRLWLQELRRGGAAAWRRQ